MKLAVIPLGLDEANAFIRAHHRHHGEVIGHKFSLGAADGNRIAGVAVVGRPVARLRDDGLTLEVARLCTDGTRNACSFLYGAAARATFALGYKRLGTYILASENGASLKASGWRLIGEVAGRSWSCPSRPRVDTHPLQDKLLFRGVGMTDLIRDHLPWLLSALTVWMTLLAGNKHPSAWAVGLVNQALWLAWIIAVEAWGLIPLNLALWVVYGRNHWKWNAGEKTA